MSPEGALIAGLQQRIARGDQDPSQGRPVVLAETGGTSIASVEALASEAYSVESAERRGVHHGRLADAALILCTILGTALASGWMLLLTSAELQSFSRYAEIESLWSRSLLLGIPAVLSLGSMAFGGWVVSAVFRAGWRRLQSRWGYGLYS